MKLERSTPQDAKECVDWMMANLARNDCSPRTLKGCTFYKIPGVLYLPVKPVLLLESLASNPEVTGTKRLLALRRAMEDLQKIYPGVEFVFLTRPNTRLAETAKSYGFEEAKDYVLCRLLDAKTARKTAKHAKKSIPEVRLQDNPGAHRPDDASPTRVMRDMPETPRGESPYYRPQRRDNPGARDSL